MKLKKLLISVLILGVMMLAFSACAPAAGGAAGAEAGAGGAWTSILMVAIIFVLFYFLMIRPENKRKKKAQDMRDKLEVGDKIVTIGGMIGKIVHVSDDKVTFETGEDRVRIEVAKWAISTNEGKGANKEKEDSEETLE